jgi:hypothetical protein
MRGGNAKSLAHGLGSRVCGVADMVMTVVETLRKASARNYSPERAAQPSGCNAAGFRHFAMATNRSCPGQIKIRPSAATGYPAISRVD